MDENMTALQLSFMLCLGIVQALRPADVKLHLNTLGVPDGGKQPMQHGGKHRRLLLNMKTQPPLSRLHQVLEQHPPHINRGII
eukprot:9333342-Heterocapsa_arctica.AAC.1